MDPEAIDELVESSSSAGRGARADHGGVDDPRLLDFSANVNPNTPPGTAGVYDAALAAASAYPSGEAAEFRSAAAAFVECETTEVIPTAGGMAAIRLAIATTVDRDDRVLVPAPSFAEYAREVRLQGGVPEFVDADQLLGSDPAPYEMTIVCQPNNPTGRAYDPDRLRSFAGRCRKNATCLLVDEAFLDYIDLASMVTEPGTIVARSLTKVFGLPGLRMGFAVATGRHRDRLAAARPTWGVSVPALAVGTHCLDHPEFVAATRRRVRQERTRMRERLSQRFDVNPSDAPFLLLAADESATVDAVLAAARESGIAVRDARTFRGLDRHVRVAVRRPEENDRLLEALDV